MTPCPQPRGFLMRQSWRGDVVLAHKLELSGGRFAPAQARKEIDELLTGRIGEDDRCDVCVLVSELVTNAVRHGEAGEQETIVLHLAVASDVVRIEVCDQGPGFEPPPVPRRRAGGGGHGLVLLARMSSEWGVASDDGTCVWFERLLHDRAA